MEFRGRTVVAFVLLAMFVSSILTLTVHDVITDVTLAEQGGQKTDQTQQKPVTTKPVLSEQEMSKILSTYQLIRNEYFTKVEQEKIIEGAIEGMLSVLDDPYTVYMDPKEARQFNESVESSFTGIGAVVTMKEGKVTVISPIKGSPAERAGVMAKDVILSVNGEKLDGLSLNEAVMKIRGPKGTQAKIKLIREGNTQPIDVIVVRDDIDVETVFSEMLEDGIGKIQISQFAYNTADHFVEQLKDLEKKGLKALIIDVRNDPGGVLPVVIDIAKVFVPQGKMIVQVESREGKRDPFTSEGSGRDYPITVLINKGSASASEILAAAIRESAGGKLIGETTFGKGTVQATFGEQFKDGSNIKMTIAKWLTPQGNFIHDKGIEPDIAVEQPKYFSATPLPRDRVLKYDDVGEEVENLQIMLQGLGLEPGRTDGYFGKGTELAVKTLQRNHKLVETGQVDDKTAEKIEQLLIDVVQILRMTCSFRKRSSI
jgi:carboxyl-terminal processing protease